MRAGLKPHISGHEVIELGVCELTPGLNEKNMEEFREQSYRLEVRSCKVWSSSAVYNCSLTRE